MCETMNFIANNVIIFFSGSLLQQSDKSKVSDIYIIIISEQSNPLDFFFEFTRLVMQGDLIFIQSSSYVHK
jgi:hypothetical protein